MNHKLNRFAPRALVPRSAWLLCAILLASAVLWTSNAAATVMRYADMARLIEISDVIVHGTVADQQTIFDNERGHIVTNTTLEIKHAFLGDVSKTVRFQQWGGTFEDKTAYIPGDAPFEKNEEVILFLRRGLDGDNTLYLSALSQAKYKVHRNDDGKTIISRDLSDLSFVHANSAKPVGVTDEAVSGEQSFYATLESLIAGIKQIDVPPRGGLQ